MPVPMAASAALAVLLDGPRRPVTVAAATPHAWYLTTGDRDVPALCLAVPGAVRVPCAAIVPVLPTEPAPAPGPAPPAELAPAPGPVLPTEPAPWSARSGRWSGADVGTLGGGELRVGTSAYRVARWWRPARPRAVPAARLRAVAVAVSSRVPPADDPAWQALWQAVAAHAPLRRPLLRLLGRGPGLTPYWDDVLAGALVALAATGSWYRWPLATAVCALAPGRTTVVSAALLRHAARGECVPELGRLLAASDEDGRAAAAEALLRVGHSSGEGLARGLAAVGLAVAA